MFIFNLTLEYFAKQSDNMQRSSSLAITQLVYTVSSMKQHNMALLSDLGIVCFYILTFLYYILYNTKDAVSALHY